MTCFSSGVYRHPERTPTNKVAGPIPTSLTSRAKILAQAFYKDSQKDPSTKLNKGVWLAENDPGYPSSSMNTFYTQVRVWERMQAKHGPPPPTMDLSDQTDSTAQPEAEPVELKKAADFTDAEQLDILCESIALFHEGEALKGKSGKVPNGYGPKGIFGKMVKKYGWSHSPSHIRETLQREAAGETIVSRKARIDKHCPPEMAAHVLAVGGWFRKLSMPFNRHSAIHYFKLYMVELCPKEVLNLWVWDIDAEPLIWDEEKVRTTYSSHAVRLDRVL